MQRVFDGQAGIGARSETKAAGSELRGLRRSFTNLQQLGQDLTQLGQELLGVGGEQAPTFIDRGTTDQREREKAQQPSLVAAGRHAGRSRVRYVGGGRLRRLLALLADYYHTLGTQPMWVLVAGTFAAYQLSWWFFGLWWWVLGRYAPGCVGGCVGRPSTSPAPALECAVPEMWTMSIIVLQSIGYGNTYPQRCWGAAWVTTVEAFFSTVLSGLVIGVIFAKISFPSRRAESSSINTCPFARARTIFMTDKAVVSRRDGQLKLMFRIADIRPMQVTNPKVAAYLYTWGEGRNTAEGEHIPVRAEPLNIGYIDGMLLLPVKIEHPIDERSPLCGHTHDTLSALHAEIVVKFEGTSEMGNPFMARRSYLPKDLLWGHDFVQIVHRPGQEVDGRARPYFWVNLDKRVCWGGGFHTTRRQADYPDLPPDQLSAWVVGRARRTVPYPLLFENTLVLSDVLCLRPSPGGYQELVCRVGDTYPNNMLESTGTMHLYRWKSLEEAAAAPGQECFEYHQLDLGQKAGTNRLQLRLPHEVVHVIDADSPLVDWLQPGGMAGDRLSEVVVLINSYVVTPSTADDADAAPSLNLMRQRTYRVATHVRAGFDFCDVVARGKRPGAPAPEFRINWRRFHTVAPVGAEGYEEPNVHAHAAALGSGPMQALARSRDQSVAPESHANILSQEMLLAAQLAGLRGLPGDGPDSAKRGGRMSVLLSDRDSMLSGGEETGDARSLPPRRATSLPSVLSSEEFTVMPGVADMRRYQPKVAGDTAPRAAQPARPRLPTAADFAAASAGGAGDAPGGAGDAPAPEDAGAAPVHGGSMLEEVPEGGGGAGATAGAAPAPAAGGTRRRVERPSATLPADFTLAPGESDLARYAAAIAEDSDADSDEDSLPLGGAARAARRGAGPGSPAGRGLTPSRSLREMFPPEGPSERLHSAAEFAAEAAAAAAAAAAEAGGAGADMHRTDSARVRRAPLPSASEFVHAAAGGAGMAAPFLRRSALPSADYFAEALAAAEAEEAAHGGEGAARRREQARAREAAAAAGAAADEREGESEAPELGSLARLSRYAAMAAQPSVVEPEEQQQQQQQEREWEREEELAREAGLGEAPEAGALSRLSRYEAAVVQPSVVAAPAAPPPPLARVAEEEEWRGGGEGEESPEALNLGRLSSRYEAAIARDGEEPGPALPAPPRAAPLPPRGAAGGGGGATAPPPAALARLQAQLRGGGGAAAAGGDDAEAAEAARLLRVRSRRPRLPTAADFFQGGSGLPAAGPGLLGGPEAAAGGEEQRAQACTWQTASPRRRPGAAAGPPSPPAPREPGSPLLRAAALHSAATAAEGQAAAAQQQGSPGSPRSRMRLGDTFPTISLDRRPPAGGSPGAPSSPLAGGSPVARALASGQHRLAALLMREEEERRRLRQGPAGGGEGGAESGEAGGEARPHA
eukprot:scaffold2.g7248.t1